MHDGLVSAISPQQLARFRAFGFILLPGVFTDVIDEVATSFDEVFADESNPRLIQTDNELHGFEQRCIIMQIADRHPVIGQLRDDPRVASIVHAILGDDAQYAESDASVFSCDTEWHADTYGAPMTIHHVKLSFYLDELTADTGAPRFIPGTNDYKSEYARTVRRALTGNVGTAEDVFGVPSREIPAVPLESRPGDVVVWDYRTIHASYGGGSHRRLISLNYREPDPAPQ